MATNLPVVDFNLLKLGIKQDDIPKEVFEAVAHDLVAALSTVGFVYMINHGVQAATVDRATKLTEEFFALPAETKEKYCRVGNTNHGWGQTEIESLNPERPGDLKEFYNVTPAHSTSWPDAEVAGFSEVSKDLVAQGHELTSRILFAMGLGLHPQNPNVFVDYHKADTPGTMSTLRYLRYPPVTDNIKPGQIRCGEHSDYGSVTLLFQDAAGGLQVLSRSGEWVDATPIPGAVLVNIGDLMQRWTSDKLVSTKHRVVIPEEEILKKQVRRSMVYFAHPDNDALITCIDGSNKYEPVNSVDYLNMRYSVTY